MAVSDFLAVQIMGDDPDPTIVEQVWLLAERHNDESLMTKITGLRMPLPAPVAERAKARKEVSVRVAYLSRNDVDDAVRTELLGAERRADVFAGLIGASRNNEGLRTRLAAAFAAKPTKVLAKAMLKDNFSDNETLFNCLMLLARDLTLPDGLVRSMQRVANASASDPARYAAMITALRFDMLLGLPVEQLPDDAVPAMIARLCDYAGGKLPSTGSGSEPSWERRRNVETAIRRLVDLVDRADAASVARINELIADGAFDVGSRERLAAAFVVQKAAGTGASDERRVIARTASGAELDTLIQSTLSLQAESASPVLQGLLENPEAFTHRSFDDLVEAAELHHLLEAVRFTGSVDLLARFWSVTYALELQPFLSLVSDRDEAVRRLFVAELATLDPNSGGRASMLAVQRLSRLARFNPPTELIGMIPLSESDNHRWRSTQLFSAFGKQITELQTSILGSDVSAWENYNNLIDNWSGTLLDLLETSRTL